MPHPNVPLWFRDYCELKAVEEKRIRENSLTSLYLQKSSACSRKAAPHFLVYQEGHMIMGDSSRLSPKMAPGESA